MSKILAYMTLPDNKIDQLKSEFEGKRKDESKAKGDTVKHLS